MAWNFDAAKIYYITDESKPTLQEVANKFHIPFGSITSVARPRSEKSPYGENWALLRRQHHRKLVESCGNVLLVQQRRRRVANVKVSEDVINLFAKTLKIKSEGVKCPKCGEVVKVLFADFSVKDFELMAKLQEYLSGSGLDIKKTLHLHLDKPIGEYTDTELASLLDKGKAVDAEVVDD